MVTEIWLQNHLLFPLGWGMCFCMDTFDLWETLLWNSYIKPEGAFPHLSLTVVLRTSFSLVLGFIFCFLSGPKSNWSLYIIYMFIWLSVQDTCIYMYTCAQACVYTLQSINMHIVKVKCSVMPLFPWGCPWCTSGNHPCHWSVSECLLYCSSSLEAFTNPRWESPSPSFCVCYDFFWFPFLKKPRIACALARHPPLTSCLANPMVSCGSREIDEDTCDQQIPCVLCWFLCAYQGRGLQLCLSFHFLLL